MAEPRRPMFLREQEDLSLSLKCIVCPTNHTAGRTTSALYLPAYVPAQRLVLYTSLHLLLYRKTPAERYTAVEGKAAYRVCMTLRKLT